MVLKCILYLSTDNQYCQINVKGAYINMKLIVGNRLREPGTDSLFLI